MSNNTYASQTLEEYSTYLESLTDFEIECSIKAMEKAGYLGKWSRERLQALRSEKSSRSLNAKGGKQ